jgi:hypothetical protein
MSISNPGESQHRDFASLGKELKGVLVGHGPPKHPKLNIIKKWSLKNQVDAIAVSGNRGIANQPTRGEI